MSCCCDSKLQDFISYDSTLIPVFVFRYRTLGHSASQSRISTFFLLLDLMQFFDLYHAGQQDTALDVSFIFKKILAGVFFFVLLLLLRATAVVISSLCGTIEITNEQYSGVSRGNPIPHNNPTITQIKVNNW